MRALLAALILASASIAVPAAPAFADGIDRPTPPRHRPRPAPRRPAPQPAPVPLTPAPVIEPASLRLSDAMFTGGVGLDLGTGFVGGGGRTIVQGASVTAISFSSASASATASASARGGSRGGGHGGGGGCGCH